MAYSNGHMMGAMKSAHVKGYGKSRVRVTNGRSSMLSAQMLRQFQCDATRYLRKCATLLDSATKTNNKKNNETKNIRNVRQLLTFQLFVCHDA